MVPPFPLKCFHRLKLMSSFFVVGKLCVCGINNHLLGTLRVERFWKVIVWAVLTCPPFFRGIPMEDGEEHKSGRVRSHRYRREGRNLWKKGKIANYKCMFLWLSCGGTLFLLIFWTRQGFSWIFWRPYSLGQWLSMLPSLTVQFLSGASHP